jgi:RNA polymerase primary sigma factor
MRQLKISKKITTRDQDSLDRYLSEISRLDMITADQEVELAKRIKEGDQVALQKLAKANLRFVVSVAKQYQNNGVTLNDLISEGNLGLIRAATRFDETRGFKFISYAVWWIRQAIMEALAEQPRVVRLPLNRVSNLSKIAKASATLEQKFQREPSAEELAHVLEIKVSDVEEGKRLAVWAVSIQAPLMQGEEGSLMDVLIDKEGQTTDHELVIHSLKQEITHVLSSLSERESEVIVSYFGLNGSPAMSLDEIAGRFSLTRERVRQIKEKTLRKLRSGSRAKLLMEYL